MKEMTKSEIEDIFGQAFQVYGKKHQMVVAIEECGELGKEVSKYYRDKGNETHLKEEIADVLIMIWQLIKMLNLSVDDIKKIIIWKVKRLRRRIRNEQSNTNR